MSLTALGCLILWLGWFGFNPGSTMAADPVNIGHIALTTNMAAATGAISATIVAWLMFKKPDLSMTVNGCLAGLVAITAPCAWVSIPGAAVIGVIGGALVVVGVVCFDKLKIDDPVGALSVHLLNGLFGTLAVGLFASPDAPLMLQGKDGPHPGVGLFYGGGFTQAAIQLKGMLASGAYVFAISLAVWFALKVSLGIRVKPEEEIEGLDIGEHGMEAYPGFAKEDGLVESHSTGVLAPGVLARAAAEVGGPAKKGFATGSSGAK